MPTSREGLLDHRLLLSLLVIVVVTIFIVIVGLSFFRDFLHTQQLFVAILVVSLLNMPFLRLLHQFDDANRGESGFSTDDWHDSWTGGDEHDDVADAWEREYDHADGKLRARKGWAKGLDLFR